MATITDVLSPALRIAGLDQTPVTDPLAPTVPAVPEGGPGPGPGLRPLAPPTTPKTPMLASRNLYGPSRIQGELYGGQASRGPSSPDPSTGLAQRINTLATSPEAAPTGFLGSRTGQAIKAALYGLGETLPPQNFLGSVGRGFTTTVNALQAGQAQQQQARDAATAGQQAAFTRGLINQLTQAKIDALTGPDDPAKPVLYQGGPGQPPGWTTPGTDGGPPTFTPLPGVQPRPVPVPGGGVNPLDTKYGQILEQVRREMALGLPKYATEDAVNAEAQRRMTQQYGRSPGFRAWQQTAFNGGGRNSGGPSGGPIPVTKAELQAIQAQHPGVDVRSYYTVTDQ